MKKQLFLSLITILISGNNLVAQFSIPQLQAGVTVNDSIGSINWVFNNCYPFPNFDLGIDPNLIPISTGLELKCIVTELTSSPDSAYTSEQGILHIFDTLNFTIAQTFYTFFCNSPGEIHLKLLLTGIPSVPFENYPCQLNILDGASWCYDPLALIGIPDECTVDDFTFVNNFSKNCRVSIKYNQHANKLELAQDCDANRNQIFCIFNLQGQEIKKYLLTNNFQSINYDVSSLQPGIYFCKLTDDKGNQITSKFLVNKMN